MGWEALFYATVAALVLGGILLTLAALGAALPRYHEVSRTVELRQTSEALWQAITDFARVPEWHPAIVRVEMVSDQGGREVWRETYRRSYPITLETSEADAPRRLVRVIAGEKGPFSGQWEFDLTPTARGCRVTLTERGDIANPFLRLIARLLMKPATYLDMYLDALARKFGE